MIRLLPLAVLCALLAAQDTPRYTAEKVVSNLKYVDGLAWSHSGFLVLADVRQRKLFRADSDPMLKPLRDDDGGASGVAYDLQSRLYICESGARRVTRLDSKGKLDVVADSFEGKKFNSPNDVVVRRDYNVYFTDPAFGSALDHRELDFYGIYHVSPKGELDALAKWRTRPNGIAISADGKILYVSDSDRHVIVAFDLDRNGAGSNQRDVVQNIAGVPGGIKTDVDGRMYVAARGVSVYSPAGKLLRTFIEGTNSVNLAFGESDFQSLFISSRNEVFRVRLDVKGAIQY